MFWKINSVGKAREQMKASFKREIGEVVEGSEEVKMRWNESFEGLFNVADIECLGWGGMHSESHEKWFGEDSRGDESLALDEVWQGSGWYCS